MVFDNRRTGKGVRMQVKYSFLQAFLLGVCLFAWPSLTVAKKLDFRLSEGRQAAELKAIPAAKLGREPSSVAKPKGVPALLLSKDVPSSLQSQQRKDLCTRSFDTLTAREQCTTSIVSF